MRKAEYRGAGLGFGSSGCVIIAIGVVGQIGAMYWAFQTYGQSLGAWTLAVGAAPLLVALLVALWVGTLASKERVKTLKPVVERAGFTMWEVAIDEERARVAVSIDPLVQTFGLRGGVDGLIWFASSREGLALEHTYTRGYGKHQEEVVHTVVAWSQTGLASRESAVWVKRPFFGERGNYRRTWGEATKTGVAEFDKNFLVYGEQGLVGEVVSGEVQEILFGAPKGETLYVGAGLVALCYPRAVTAENLEILIRRAKDLGLLMGR